MKHTSLLSAIPAMCGSSAHTRGIREQNRYWIQMAINRWAPPRVFYNLSGVRFLVLNKWSSVGKFLCSFERILVLKYWSIFGLNWIFFNFEIIFFLKIFFITPISCKWHPPKKSNRNPLVHQFPNKNLRCDYIELSFEFTKQKIQCQTPIYE